MYYSKASTYQMSSKSFQDCNNGRGFIVFLSDCPCGPFFIVKFFIDEVDVVYEQNNLKKPHNKWILFNRLVRQKERSLLPRAIYFSPLILMLLGWFMGQDKILNLPRINQQRQIDLPCIGRYREGALQVMFRSNNDITTYI